MGPKAAGSVFWACLLVLLVAVQLTSPGCVTYTHTQACGIEGSSVEFHYSYPKTQKVISISGWSKKSPPNNAIESLEQMPTYSSRMNIECGINNCTMKLTDLRKSDTSIYYFKYNFRNVIGQKITCQGVPGVRLHIFASPVSILVQGLVMGQYVPVADWTVIEGQRIMLICVSTCAANLNSNPSYIWYKNRLQLHGSSANSRILSLDPISNEDGGSYVCATIGYKHLPSSAVNLTVEGRPRNTVSDGGSKKDSAPTVTHDCDGQNSTDQIFNNCHTPKGDNMFTFSIMLTAVVCAGWLIVIMVAILNLKVKRWKRERCAGSDARSLSPNSNSYIPLDINFMSAEYDTLDTERRCSAADTIYENSD